MNRHQMANDPRWQEIERWEDVIAVIEGISECAHFITMHAIRFNPLNPVQNMYRIKQEIDTLSQLLETLRLYLIRQRNGVEHKIKGNHR